MPAPMPTGNHRDGGAERSQDARATGTSRIGIGICAHLLTHSLTLITHPLARSLTLTSYSLTHLLATCYVSQAFVQSCVAASQTRCERGGAHHPELLSFLFTSK